MQSDIPRDAYVVQSLVLIEPDAEAVLEDAFRNRLGEVDTWPGFLGLQVWKDVKRSGHYVMVSWWSDKESFRRYMRSDAHKRSHRRMPRDPAPSAGGVSQFEVIA